jgi:hypothetical protein
MKSVFFKQNCVNKSRGPTEQLSPSPHLKIETVPVSETVCFLVFRIPDDGQRSESQ